MKKRFSTLFCSIMIIALFLSACGEVTETIHSETSTQTVGSYSIFRTTESQDYLNFLESFDESKYEIENISTSMGVNGGGSDEFYMVTYKQIAE